MFWIMTKYALTAGMVVLISEVAKRSDKVGALTAALPTVTILALIWMYIEGKVRKSSPITLTIPSGMYCRLCRCS